MPRVPGDVDAVTWPEASLDRIARLRLLAGVLPGAVLREYRIPVPFETCWAYLSDLERSVPEFDRDVRKVSVRRASGTRLRIWASLPWRLSGLPLPMDVELDDGWCLMTARPRIYVVGMAAEPDGEATRLAHCEGITVTGPPRVRALARPLLRVTARRTRRHVDHDVEGILARLNPTTPGAYNR